MFIVTFVIMLPITLKTNDPIKGWEAGLVNEPARTGAAVRQNAEAEGVGPSCSASPCASTMPSRPSFAEGARYGHRLVHVPLSAKCTAFAGFNPVTTYSPSRVICRSAFDAADAVPTVSPRFGSAAASMPHQRGVAFKEPAKIESGNARAFLAWLTGRVDLQAIAAGPLRLSGDIAFGSGTIAIDRLDVEIDRMKSLGSFAYSRPSNDRPCAFDGLAKPSRRSFARWWDATELQQNAVCSRMLYAVLSQSSPRSGTRTIGADSHRCTIRDSWSLPAKQ
jgi:hypothetical protein